MHPSSRATRGSLQPIAACFVAFAAFAVSWLPSTTAGKATEREPPVYRVLRTHSGVEFSMRHPVLQFRSL